MLSLGNKKSKGHHLGNKFQAAFYVGNKHMPKNETQHNRIKPTPDGNITNYSNSANQLYEPIRGVHIDNKKKNFLLEKQHRNNSHDHYN
jgi:hypothetical protein